MLGNVLKTVLNFLKTILKMWRLHHLVRLIARLFTGGLHWSTLVNQQSIVRATFGNTEWFNIHRGMRQLASCNHGHSINTQNTWELTVKDNFDGGVRIGWKMVRLWNNMRVTQSFSVPVKVSYFAWWSNWKLRARIDASFWMSVNRRSWWWTRTEQIPTPSW